jgi:hypothetical protein
MVAKYKEPWAFWKTKCLSLYIGIPGPLGITLSMVVGITLSNGLGPGHSQNNGPLLAWKAYYFGNNPTPLGVTLHLAHIFVFRLHVGRGPFTIWGKIFSFLEKFSPITKSKIKHLKKKWFFSPQKWVREKKKKKKKRKNREIHIFVFHYVAKDKKMIKDFYFISHL